MQNIVILGSTGSIGKSTLDVIDLNRDKYQVYALVANSDVLSLVQQCIKYKPKYVIIANPLKFDELNQLIIGANLTTKVSAGSLEVAEIVKHDDVDIVMSAIVGSQGLLPTYNALTHGKKVLLANKESLVAGGRLMIDAKNSNPYASLLPVDSEHNAIFQCLPHDYTNNQKAVNKIILTASGGPFRCHTREQLVGISSSEAIKHPNWSMGKKISVDSSTLMNKGLELIEAFWLFDLPLEQIDVVVHPQSIIHSMVEYVDGSILAQMGTPDMKTPIAYSLAYPERISSGSKYLDFTSISSLTFEKPDFERFPCLQLAFEALKIGRALPLVLNAANEIAVEAFLNEKIGFYDINCIVERAMKKFDSYDYTSVDDVLKIDNETRQYAITLI